MKNLKNIVGWISIVLIAIITISTILVRFVFPELTETQLFLKTWWIFIPLAFCAVGFSWGFESN